MWCAQPCSCTPATTDDRQFASIASGVELPDRVRHPAAGVQRVAVRRTARRGASTGATSSRASRRSAARTPRPSSAAPCRRRTRRAPRRRPPAGRARRGSSARTAASAPSSSPPTASRPRTGRTPGGGRGRSAQRAAGPPPCVTANRRGPSAPMRRTVPSALPAVEVAAHRASISSSSGHHGSGRSRRSLPLRRRLPVVGVVAEAAADRLARAGHQDALALADPAVERVHHEPAVVAAAHPAARSPPRS